MSATSPRRRVAAALAAALLAGLCTAWLTRPAASAPSVDAPLSRTATTLVAPPTPSAATTPRARSARTTYAASPQQRPRVAATPLLGRPAPRTPEQGNAPAPTTFSIKRLGITMDVKPEGVAKDGEMALAPDPADIGWYRYGARPGDPHGATVLAGHVDEPRYGIGPLVALGELRRGDVLTVRSGTQVRRYGVETVTATKKTALDLSTLFTREGPPRLHVVTCGGNFDQEQRRYDGIIVVVAIPLR